ncbi:unnamed protein product [Blepharisma stoltei]|uniref:non-specific serine/threonine protein kinase n=1 Tax=Blepharisma stoltei TaxID=1481888 RepID=A0AAU9JDK6_9CILI|nr:unnamed protein product [Blepharisma stoltei]
MNSIFELMDSNSCGTDHFWAPYISSNEPTFFEGSLFDLKSGLFQEKFYTVIGKSLVRWTSSKQKAKMAKLEWKPLNPFIDENQDEKLYGFSLGHKNSSKDFYVKSSSELDKWVDCLSSICIMSDIEDDYQISQQIGSGNSSVVHLGVRIQDSKKFAIKKVSKKKIQKSKINLENLINEIKIMRKLNHPNIIKLHRVYESPHNIYLVLDYVKGGDLYSRILEKGSLPESTVIKFSKKLLKVLSYTQSCGVVHRDIKPENILMISKNNDYNFKLADFGLAAEVTNENLTLRCGSPGYIAPEILRKCSYGVEADVFSAGIILYVLLSGHMPFFSKSAEGVLLRNRDCLISYRDEVWKKISKNAINLIQNLTDTQPNKRLTPKKALDHPWLSTLCKAKRSSTAKNSDREIEEVNHRSQSLMGDSDILQARKTIILSTNFAPMKNPRKIINVVKANVNICDN